MMKIYVKNGYEKSFHTLDSDAPSSQYPNPFTNFHFT